MGLFATQKKYISIYRPIKSLNLMLKNVLILELELEIFRQRNWGCFFTNLNCDYYLTIKKGKNIEENRNPIIMIITKINNDKIQVQVS